MAALERENQQLQLVFTIISVVEAMVDEFAKELVWEERFNVFEDQLFIFANQQRKLRRLTNHNVDVALHLTNMIIEETQ